MRAGFVKACCPSHSHQLVLWCSWLSLLSNTQAVPGSNPGGIISFAGRSITYGQRVLLFVQDVALFCNASSSFNCSLDRMAVGVLC
ncbi:hypothetical protein M438DRAFT_199334 [Aureobasidium pullulans EXF-150]|uniref:Secreted protein n=1 Tax=Aureobasidium pullulans EXF-150 TaxID=1043002 RepID=A0A074XUP9_AURPU|nr:uncharacterized protein M438DRAFT_199334 [Aureobasidium pullulans EXF-150]KEQ85652.1 hypothetical protein M438DRAFT_199334 [Aureobasidium pullulans EXF-150]